MVKPILLVIGAIPVVFAILIALPMITKPDIPRTAYDPYDEIKIQYTKHQLKTISFGVTERTGSQKTEILTLNNDGDVRFSVTIDGQTQPDKKYKIDENKLRKITALIKETGFMAIPSESFPVRDGVDEYQKSTLSITLNDQTRLIHWPEQNATEKFVPPIITLVELELDTIINELIE